MEQNRSWDTYIPDLKEINYVIYVSYNQLFKENECLIWEACKKNRQVHVLHKTVIKLPVALFEVN
jgi:hypothetical protein